MGNINYFGKNGELWFSYKKEFLTALSKFKSIFEFSDKIPEEIQRQGEEAIQGYAERKIKESIKKKKAIIERENEFATNPDFIVAILHDGKTLQGKIISAEDSILKVRLTAPFIGEAHVHYGFIAAMAGKYIFDGLEKFSEDAINSAKRLLIQIYDDGMHYKENKEIIDLANRLNNNP